MYGYAGQFGLELTVILLPQPLALLELETCDYC